jgi:hypothetical protein
MKFRSEFWCSRNCRSTMRAFPGSAFRVIWYFHHTADRHPRSCDISFIKTPIQVWLKASETSFPRKGIPWGHFAWFWKGLHVYFLQLVVFVWQIKNLIVGCPLAWLWDRKFCLYLTRAWPVAVNKVQDTSWTGKKSEIHYCTTPTSQRQFVTNMQRPAPLYNQRSGQCGN